MKQRCILIAFFILKYYGLIEPNEMAAWIEFSRNDFEFCPKCFDRPCDLHHFQNIEWRWNGVAATMVNIFGNRNVQLAEWTANNSGSPVILKYLSNTDVTDRVKAATCRTAIGMFGFLADLECDSIWKIIVATRDERIGDFFQIDRLLYRVFVSNEWTDGITLCPNIITVEDAVDFKRNFNSFSNDATFWLQTLINPELVAMQTFQKSKTLQRFVPKVVDWCGFAIVEEYKGNSLYDYYHRSLNVRLLLAKQLIEAAIAFADGVDGFRIYFTDATPDNIVVDPKTLNISFVDLDNLLIVNSNAIPSKKVHRNEQIDCDSCFAYVPQELCTYQLSDINIFAMCQIFNHDLFAANTKGLLHSYADELDASQSDRLSKLLNRCIQCDKMNDCDNRFTTAHQLLELFQDILAFEIL